MGRAKPSSGEEFRPGEVALDLRRVGGLGAGEGRVREVVPAGGVVVDLGPHAGTGLVGPRAGVAPVVAVEDVAGHVVEAGLQVQDQVHLRLARARRQEDVAELHQLELQPGVLLHRADGRSVVVLRHGEAEGLQLVPGQRGRDRLRRPLAVGQAQHRRTGSALDRGLAAAVGDARIRVGDRPGTRAVSARTGTSVGEGHGGLAPADGVPRLGDAVGQVPGAPLGLGVADVGPGPDYAVGKDLGIVAQVRALGRADIALAEHEGGAEVALDHALERGQVVGADQVVGVVRLGVLAEVGEHGQRTGFGARDVVEAQDRQPEVGVVVGVAGGRAVVGGGGRAMLPL